MPFAKNMTNLQGSAKNVANSPKPLQIQTTEKSAKRFGNKTPDNQGFGVPRFGGICKTLYFLKSAISQKQKSLNFSV